MKDVSLDDLIKEDKAKNKSARPKKSNHPAVILDLIQRRKVPLPRLSKEEGLLGVQGNLENPGSFDQIENLIVEEAVEILREDPMISKDPIEVEIKSEIKRFKETIINKPKNQSLNNKSLRIKRVEL